MFSLWTRYPCASYHRRDSAAQMMGLSFTTGANGKGKEKLEGQSSWENTISI